MIYWFEPSQTQIQLELDFFSHWTYSIQYTYIYTMQGTVYPLFICNVGKITLKVQRRRIEVGRQRWREDGMEGEWRDEGGKEGGKENGGEEFEVLLQ